MQLKEVYDEIAEDWNNKHQFPHPAQLITLKNWKGKILDLGCGNCINLTIFEGSELYGLDFSENMIKEAEKFCKDNEMEVLLKVGDILNTGYPDKYFDYIIFSKAIQHLKKKDHFKAMIELRRILKDGGKCFIACWNKKYEDNLDKKKEAMIPWILGDKIYERYYYFFDEQELIDLIKETGFKVKEKLSESDSKNICLVIS
ncbi:MAG: class I SAM-dependent methyltransferase [Nanoarchaeota archaeon]|nr:class I SAM-dependent methyltransferase [Nanoarchaeota archaeon]